jgi:hypothetical protein
MHILASTLTLLWAVLDAVYTWMLSIPGDNLSAIFVCNPTCYAGWCRSCIQCPHWWLAFRV